MHLYHMNNIDLTSGIYRHYKGDLYDVIGVGYREEDEVPVVIYKALYESDYPYGTIWVRRLDDFREMVMVEGREVPRFAKVEQ